MNDHKPSTELSVTTSGESEHYDAALRAGAAGDLRQARDELTIVLRDDPQHTSALMRLKVLDDVESERIPPATATHLFKEVLFSIGGRRQESLAEGDASIALSPDYAEAWRLRGRTRVEVGDLDGAIADYSRAITLDESDALAYQNRGNARLRRSDFAGALVDFDEALRREPSNPEAYVNRATALALQNRHELAIRDLDKAIELGPGLPQPYVNKAEIYARTGQLREAVETLKELLVRARPSYRGEIEYAKQRLKQLEAISLELVRVSRELTS